VDLRLAVRRKAALKLFFHRYVVHCGLPVDEILCLCTRSAAFVRDPKSRWANGAAIVPPAGNNSFSTNPLFRPFDERHCEYSRPMILGAIQPSDGGRHDPPNPRRCYGVAFRLPHYYLCPQPSERPWSNFSRSVRNACRRPRSYFVGYLLRDCLCRLDCGAHWSFVG
jgi:hypothetical protein